MKTAISLIHEPSDEIKEYTVLFERDGMEGERTIRAKSIANATANFGRSNPRCRILQVRLNS